MNLREAFVFAAQGVTANKMRSALTTLGILIGVAAVIILVAVGTGSSKAVADSISGLGSNTLTITASGTGGGGRGGPPAGFPGRVGGTGSVTSGTKIRSTAISLADAQALVDEELAPDVAGVAPVVSVSSVTALYEGASHTVSSTIGTSSAYLLIDNDTVSAGRAFTDEDYMQRHRVVLVGTSVAEDLAGGDGNALLTGTINLNGKDFQVIGILTEKGATGPNDSDDRVIAPLTAVQDALAGYGSLSSISVQAASAQTATAAQQQVQAILDARHHVTASSRDYSVVNSAALLSAATSSNKTFTVLLGAVAAISLLVGGIGVMNIMLVTVTERTREIGIRQAIGARRADIVGQFLIEAVMLALFGGVVGVLIGLLGSRFTIIGVQPVVAPYSVLLAFSVAVVTGLVFGIYPANRAASLRPIEALRYE